MRFLLIPIASLLITAASCTAQTKTNEVSASQSRQAPVPSAGVKSSPDDFTPDNANTNPADSQASDEKTEIEKLLDKGEIAQAVKLLNARVSAKSISDENVKHLQSLLLKAAHREGLKFAEGKNYKKAAAITETAFQAAPLGIEMVLRLNPERQSVTFVPTENDYRQYGFDKFLPWSEYVEIANNYGFFLEQANAPGYGIEVLRQVTEMSPQRESAHLNLADALWKSGDRRGAEAEYNRYADLMTGKGRAADIPDRVKKRLS